jgi:hypothetical protein
MISEWKFCNSEENRGRDKIDEERSATAEI